MFRLPTLRFSTCYNCRAPNPKSSFKRCKRCKTVAYCSEECQTTAWTTHRTECQSFADFQVEFPERMKRGYIEDLTELWIQTSEPILFKFALLALDLANNPNGPAMNVIIGYRTRFPDDDNVMTIQFEIMDGWACSDEVMYRGMRTRSDTGPDIEEMQSDRAKNPNTVRILIGDSTHFDAAIFMPLDGVDADSCRRQHPFLSAVRSLTWVTDLKTTLNARDPSDRTAPILIDNVPGFYV